MRSPMVDQDITSGEESAPATKPRTSAFFFGSAAQPLFGLYGPPQSHEDQDHAVLLCAPIGHEYMRAHWGLRLLGDQLIQSGFHILRFDYSCMGDSWGTFERATVAQWVHDIKTALTELQDNAGVRQTSVIGVRLGATLAFAATREVPLQHLVLCDPIFDGRAHLDELRALQKKLRRTWPYAPQCQPGAEYEDLLGYRYPAALIEQVGGLRLDAAAAPPANQVHWVLSTGDARYRQFPGDVQVVSETGSWDVVEDDLYAEPILMPNIRRAIPDLLKERA
jgi:pimeloyl-ACP methyl ester carboxylesterase